MKIGILTVHRAHNYGAVLQCYALQKFLQGMGHNVEVIDYHQPFIEKYYRLLDFRMIIGNIKTGNISFIFHIFRNIKERKIKHSLFDSFRKKYLMVTTPCYNLNDIPNDYDVYVIGSDQIWNSEIFGKKIDLVFWGCFKNRVRGKIMAYAASTRLEILQEIPESLIASYVSNFDKISIREKECKKFLEGIADYSIPVVIDPTLLLKSEDWIFLSSERFKESNYVVLYEVRKNKKNPDVLYEKAKNFSKMVGCRVFNLSNDASLSPNDFISAIFYARYIITSSFHGTAFSVIFQKNFTTFALGDGRDSRYTELLDKIGLSDRLRSLDSSPILSEPNYHKTIFNLEQLRIIAKDFFQNAIEKEYESEQV